MLTKHMGFVWHICKNNVCPDPVWKWSCGGQSFRPRRLGRWSARRLRLGLPALRLVLRQLLQEGVVLLFASTGLMANPQTKNLDSISERLTQADSYLEGVDFPGTNRIPKQIIIWTLDWSCGFSIVYSVTHTSHAPCEQKTLRMQ